MPTRRNFVTGSALAASSLVLVRSNSVLAQGSANQTTFANAWNAFNNRDWGTLAGYLSNEVVLVKVKGNHCIVGKSEVLHYVKTFVVGDNEKFDPTGALSSTTYPPPVWNVNFTAVHGTADWQDADNPVGSGVTIKPIFFRFRFNNAGKIDRMYGSPD